MISCLEEEWMGRRSVGGKRSGKGGALCSIAVVYIGSIPFSFLVSDMLIQEDEIELRCTLRFIIAWMDTVNQSINLISRPRPYP